MIDIHSHILPGMDDGCSTPQEAEQLLRLSWKQGVNIIAATPHFNPQKEDLENFLHRRDGAMQKLSLEDGMPQVLLGAEVLDFNGMHTCTELDRLCIGDSRLLLVEMPTEPWAKHMVDDMCKLMRHGILPVLAHVERYYKRNQLLKYKDQLLDWGVCFQVNADAFLARSTAKRTLQLLQKGQIHFIGSDCHNLSKRQPNLNRAIQMVYRKLGRETVRWLDTIAEETLIQG